ncbi:MAG TPA: DNA replication/repair protein RecF [Thermoleophilaceae bacterium]
MVVRSIGLRDFRNYTRAELTLGDGLTVVHGPNGAGKTNLLEAIYFALTARSCRTSNEREVVRSGESVTRVVAEVAGDDGAHSLEVGFSPSEKEKRVKVDGAALERGGAPPPRPLVCVFLPDRLELVKGAPASRRSHLDQVVAAMWPARGETRSAYSRALAQRNALLARVRAGACRADLLDAWDSELARHGAQLMADRARAVGAIAPAFASRAGELGLPEPVELRYSPRSKSTDAEGLRGELGERRAADLERGFTTHGPHRDDLTLLHGGRPLRTLGSQGQQRVGLLALLFAERDVLGARGRPPLMLLDDVMSELDATRRERLAELVRAGGQALITTTDVDHVPGASAPDVAVAAVLDGTVARSDAAVAA